MTALLVGLLLQHSAVDAATSHWLSRECSVGDEVSSQRAYWCRPDTVKDASHNRQELRIVSNV